MGDRHQIIISDMIGITKMVYNSTLGGRGEGPCRVIGAGEIAAECRKSFRYYNRSSEHTHDDDATFPTSLAMTGSCDDAALCINGA